MWVGFSLIFRILVNEMRKSGFHKERLHACSDFQTILENLKPHIKTTINHLSRGGYICKPAKQILFC